MPVFYTLLVIIVCACATVTDCQAATAQGKKKSAEGSQTVPSNSVDSLYVLGGELGNSSASCPEDIKRIFPQLSAMGLNTVLVPAYWDLLEPEEGSFDFTLTDCVLTTARENNLRVVFLWFGAWKNSMSCYAPAWFKVDTQRFPRALTAAGKPLEIASCFSENVFAADNKAFTTWWRHVAELDRGIGTVAMLQIENEIGMLEDARDHSAVADALFAAEGWEERYGASIYTDEKFMAHHYALYVERMAQSARAIYDVPLYVNAAMNSRGRVPGEYPSAGPLAHLSDIWKAAAPSLDLLAPDLYDSGFTDWVAQYAMPNNPLFIPEIKLQPNDGVRAMYIFGEHNALGFSPFSIEDGTNEVSAAYELLRQLRPIVMANRGKGTMHGLLFDQENKERVLRDGGLVLTAKHNFTLPWDPRATNGTTWPEGGGLIIRLANNEYLVAGMGIVVDFKTESELTPQTAELGEDGFALAGSGAEASSKTFSGARCGILSSDEVTIDDYVAKHCARRLNGDQDQQGRHVRISVGEWKILHVKLYQYE